MYPSALRRTLALVSRTPMETQTSLSKNAAALNGPTLTLRVLRVCVILACSEVSSSRLF